MVDESDFSCKISFIDADTNITVAEVVTDTLGQFYILSNFKKVNSQYYIKDNAFYADKETDIPVTSLLIEKDDKDVLLYIKTYTKEELSDTSIEFIPDSILNIDGVYYKIMAPDYEYSVLSDIAIDPNKEYDVTLVDFNIYNIKVTSIDKKHNKDYEFHTVMNNTVGVNIETEDTETCIMVKFNTPFTLDLYSIFSNEKENADLIVKGFYLDSKYTREFKDIKVDDYVLLSTLYLYAKTEYRTRTINYYSDGELVNSAIYTSEKDYVDYLPEAKEGYNFLGWYDENLTMKYDIDEVHSDYNLYAKWQLKSFLITLYDGNNFLLDMIVKYNQKVDKLYTPPEKKGYTFLGWKIGYSDVFYTGKEMVNNDLTLFATWSKNKYTVTYKDDDKIINTVELSYKEPYGKYEISPKEGLDFCGWLIEGTSTYIKATDVITDNVVLIADWETHKCKVQYLNQYNQILYNGEVPYNCSIGSYLYTPEKPTGYHFIGWKLHGEDDLITNDLVVNTDIILDGVFEIDEYVVTFINDEEIVHSFKVKYNNRLNELFEVEKEGYDFIGWKYNDYYLFANVNDLVTSDISLIATYNIHQYNITFYDDNKQIVNEKKINYNDTFASNLFIPEERIGYTFLGWKEEGGITYISETDVVTKDYNLYEEWGVKQCAVTYYSNNSLIADDVKTITYGNQFIDTVIETEDDKFIGWYNEDYTVMYTEKDIVSEDMSVYAKWIKFNKITNDTEFMSIYTNPEGYYKLTNDIDLKGQVLTELIEFKGALNGNGYKIKNFSLNYTSNNANSGIFAVNSGNIYNLIIMDFSLIFNTTGGSNVSIGVLCGKNSPSGVIDNVDIVSGVYSYSRTLTDINCSSFVGTIAGTNAGFIDNCSSNIDINIHTYIENRNANNGTSSFYLYNYIGGLVGGNEGIINNSKVKQNVTAYLQCYDVRDKKTYNELVYGGIVSLNYEQGKVERCYTEVSCESSDWNSHTDYGTDSNARTCALSGGLCGINYGKIDTSESQTTLTGGCWYETKYAGLVSINKTNAVISDSYAYAKNISPSKGSKYAAGFVALNDGIVQNAFSTGSVKNGNYMGGFVGENSTSGSIQKCYTTCDVTNSSSSNTGFFIGVNNGNLLYCYYSLENELMINNTRVYYDLEKNVVESKLVSKLWNQEYLENSLYFSNDKWIYLLNNNPILKNEIEEKDGEYYCTRCNNKFTKQEVEPTCDVYGSLILTCNECNTVYMIETKAPNGHNMETKVVEPTCTVPGYTLHKCHDCDYEYTDEITEVLGHTHDESTDYEGKQATCTEAGYERYTCSRCGEYINIEIEAKHNLVLVEQTNEATCTSNAYGIYQCSECDEFFYDCEIPNSKLDHIDANKDNLCDNCNETIFDETSIVLIQSEEDLTKIRNNLSGAYKLMIDIDLTNKLWSSIGNVKTPFTGYFNGNGHTIKGICLNETVMGYRGLFGYNEGIITNLNVTYNSMSVELRNTTLTYGAICAHNSGLISNCKVNGTMNITIVNSLTIYDTSDTLVNSVLVLGGIVGNNTGRVLLCTVDMTYTLSISNNVNIETSYDYDNIIQYSYKNTKATSVQDVNFGVIAGKSTGSITSCTIKGKLTIANSYPRAISSNYFGFAKAVSHLNIGNYSSLSKGVITNNTSTLIYSINNKTNQKYEDGNSFFNIYEEFNYIENIK